MTTETMTEETVKAKRTRKPVKKFYILLTDEQRVIAGLTASEVAGFLSSGKNVSVFDQFQDNDFNLQAPLANDKFQAKTVIAYQE